MRPTAFHEAPSWAGRPVTEEVLGGPLTWQAAQAFAADGALVTVPAALRRRAAAFDQLLIERGLGGHLLQRGAELRGAITLVESAPPADADSSSVAAAGVGTVHLVGGGPGDPALLTHAASTAIAHADVIFTDRLGIGERVCALAPGASIVDVGKRPGQHRVTQEDTNEHLHALACAGADVVRLKGGDVAVFGRGGEEWRFLADRGIPVQVIPGITSALALPLHAGISVTHREHSRAVTIISGHDPISPEEALSLVTLGGTVVILMGVRTLSDTVRSLRAAGMHEQTPLAIIENGCAPDERHTISTLASAVADASARSIRNPAVIILGDVVGIRQVMPDPAPAD